MKKFVIGLVLVAALVVTLANTGTAFAQRGTPGSTQAGISRGGGRGAQGGMVGLGLQVEDQPEILHDAIVAFFADTFDMTVDDLNARLDSGETLSQIALAEGYTLDEYFSLMDEARSAALAQAVADGTLTQEQADWLETRGTQAAGYGTPAAGYGTPAAGQGFGRNANPACIYPAP